MINARAFDAICMRGVVVYPYQAATAAQGIRATVERSGQLRPYFDHACGAVVSADCLAPLGAVGGSCGQRCE